MSAKSSTSLQKVSINSPQSLANFANVLKKFIVDRKLFTEIQKKNYVNVEGWEFAGACMGISPIVRSVERIQVEGEVKYHARVELIVMSTGKVVGAGEAICSNKEQGKSSYAEYAIASMAQTRAIGKSYRNSFAWLMKMAGYEATPAEEANYQVTETVEPDEVLDPIDKVVERVTVQLDAMSAADRIRSLKTTGHTDIKALSERDWRNLDEDLKGKQGEEPPTA